MHGLNMNLPSIPSVYGCPKADHYLLHDPASLPRFAHLARKAILHYVGDLYNPHLHGLEHEPFIRGMIKEFIAYKVFYKTAEYDWEWIDHSFRKYFGGCFNLDLPYSQERIDADFIDAAKAKTLIDWDALH